MTPLYIIPARGGSKGIPHKNIKEFCGKPLVCYAVEAALRLADREHVILSTDDTAIADTVARVTGFECGYIRPASLADDTSGPTEVIRHAMARADSRGVSYDAVVYLQPTSPMRTDEDILGTLQAYERSMPDVDMAVTVVESDANPYYNLYETDAGGCLHVSKGEDGAITRRQDAPKVWQMNGAVYVINPESIRRCALGELQRRIPCVMPRDRSVDLDTPLDWEIAEIIAQKKK